MKAAPTLILGAPTFTAVAAPTDDKWDVSKLDACKPPHAAEQVDVTYAKDMRPLLQQSCFRWHSAERHKGELRLDNLEAGLKGGEDGRVVIPGKIPKSFLMFAVAQVDDDITMPPKPGRGGRGAQRSGQIRRTARPGQSSPHWRPGRRVERPQRLWWSSARRSRRAGWIWRTWIRSAAQAAHHEGSCVDSRLDKPARKVNRRNRSKT